MTKKQKRTLIRIIISAFLLVCVVLIDKLILQDMSEYFRAALYLIPYFVAGYDVFFGAIRNLFYGLIFDENFLMTIATVGAMCIGFFPNTEPQYIEAVFVMLFFQVGELFQNIAVGKSRKSISELMQIYPDEARVERGEKVIEVDPENVSVGDIIVLRPGDRIPLDSVVLEGTSTVDTSALTGESVPRNVSEGDSLISGCININGVLRAKVVAPLKESTVARILALVEDSSFNKSKSENFITKFAQIYTPAVVLIALLLAFIPPLFAPVYTGVLPQWIVRALSFLVISCPCALVISIPLTFFGGIGSASKNGILVKGSNYLESLAKANTFAFDKTGTLTEGVFEVVKVCAIDMPSEELLQYVYAAEKNSTHPVAMAICNSIKQQEDFFVFKTEEVSGRGVTAMVNGKMVVCGNQRLMDDFKIQTLQPGEVGAVVHVAIDDQYAGYIVVSDKNKVSAIPAIQKFKCLGISHISMLTGDRESSAKHVAKSIGIDGCHSNLLPEDKVTVVKELKEQKDGCVVFVGDGINDAPVLVNADIGIAMGVLGSNAAIEAADIVLMDDDLQRIPVAIEIARKTMKIVKQNIWFVLCVKFIVLALGAFGFAPLWLAIFADVGVAVLAILNAMRALKFQNSL